MIAWVSAWLALAHLAIFSIEFCKRCAVSAFACSHAGVANQHVATYSFPTDDEALPRTRTWPPASATVVNGSAEIAAATRPLATATPISGNGISDRKSTR